MLIFQKQINKKLQGKEILNRQSAVDQSLQTLSNILNFTTLLIH